MTGLASLSIGYLHITQHNAPMFASGAGQRDQDQHGSNLTHARSLRDAETGAGRTVIGEKRMTNDEFEEMAEQFYRETGYLAPGKDWPAMLGGDPRGDYDVRLAKWTEWKAKRAQPTKLACEIERQFAESKLVGPARRLGTIVDECLKELRATIKCIGCNGWFSYSDVQPSSGHPEADPICNRCLDAEDWRKGVALVYAAIGEEDPPSLCCVALAEKVLAIRAENEHLRLKQ